LIEPESEAKEVQNRKKRGWLAAKVRASVLSTLVLGG